MKLFFLSMLLVSFSLSASAGKLLRPNPADLSLISDFRAEWCAANLCYGKSLYTRVTEVRSIAVLLPSGAKALYVESEPPGVELLKPRFGVVGPVNASAGIQPELGQARLTFDQKGEVDSAAIASPALGTIEGVRPR